MASMTWQLIGCAFWEACSLTIRSRQQPFESRSASATITWRILWSRSSLREVRAARRIADLGAGAGIPGLPLAVALPDSEVWLIESNGRKCQFIERAGELMGLTNVRVVNARAEGWPEGRSRVELVTARALAPLDVVAEYAAPLLDLGGHVVAWRGKREPEVEARAIAAARNLGAVGRRADPRAAVSQGRQPISTRHVEGYGNP